MNHILMAEEKIKRDDRVRYYTIRLKDAVSKNKIFKLIEKNGITSKSTAERVSKGVFDWKQGEIELFLATYCPTKSDNEVIDEVLGLNASKVSSEVAEEPVSNDKLKDGEIINHNGKKYKHIYTGEQTFEDCQKCSLFDDDIECYGSCSDRDTEIRGYFVEVAEEDMCTECDIEAAHIISELSDKNQELQKELHTSKNVITTLQKGVDELNETVTESKIAIAEVAKERDDKDEEIRVLNLELQKYKNDLNTVLDDRRKLECLLHDGTHNTEQSKEFRAIIEEMIKLHTAKNKDYGNAFTQSYAEFGTTMCVIRINDKLNRFKTLIKQDNEVKTESIKDTLIDLANYAVMTIMEIEKEKYWRD
jgi:hypothetical protein